VVSGVFTAEEDDEVGDKRSQGNTMVDLHTLLRAFLNMFLRSACFTDETLFSHKKQNVRSWDYSPQVLDYQDFWIIR
jgi:hypothetical protein